jgi:2-enoate reductase
VPPFKKDLRALLDWYKSEIQDLGVDVRFGCEVTSDLIHGEKADVVIIATGAKPIVLSIPGVEKEWVTTAPEVLLGEKKVGEKVIVVGGGLIGCETAIWLAEQKKTVTVVEMLDDLMIGSIPVPHADRQNGIRYAQVSSCDSDDRYTTRGSHGWGRAFDERRFKEDNPKR